MAISVLRPRAKLLDAGALRLSIPVSLYSGNEASRPDIGRVPVGKEDAKRTSTSDPLEFDLHFADRTY